ncbi:MAG: hypothetical protein MJZ82_01795 [Paludibacteraceae bacterium]|nr:hypothetical protein [Paludibacteraceae bacterium]
MLNHFLYGLPIALLIGVGYRQLMKVEKHQETAPEPAFICGFLIGVASFWLPSILFLMPLVYIVLIHRQSLDLRTLFAGLLGVGIVIFYYYLLVNCGWIKWGHRTFFRLGDLLTMIAPLIVIISILTITILRQRRHRR